MLVLVTIILFLFGISLVCINKYSKRNYKSQVLNTIINIVKYEHFLNFMNGFLTTVIGVTLAILLTNYDAHIKEVSKTVTLLQTADRELKMVEDNIDKFYMPAYEQLSEQGVPEKIKSLLEATPVTPLITMDIMLSNELVITKTNTYSYSALIDSQRSLKQTYDRLNEAEEIERIVFELGVLSDSVKFTRSIIKNEIDYLSNKIEEGEMREKVNSIYEESIRETSNK